MNSLAQLQNVFDNIIARIKRLETRQGPAPSYSNVLANGGFEVWNAGDSVAPDGWFTVVSAGSTLAINKSTDHSDYSNFSARVVYTQGGGAALPSFVRQTLNGPFQGYPLAVSVRVKTNVAGAVRLEMFGGGGAVGASAYHTGSGQWETLTLVVAPSILVFGIAFYVSGTFALDNAMIIQGSAPVDYIASTVGVGSGVGGGDMDTDGTVTSVALTMPAEFSVSDSPITASGTFGVTKAIEAANTVWAGPTSGSPDVPAFRALVSADIPGGGGSPTGPAGGDLDGTYPNPGVGAIVGAPVPSITGNANKFLKLNSGGGSFEFVAFGTASDTVTQGNDTRLSNARTPTAHETTHLSGGTDALPWASSIIAEGTHAARPAAASTNAGYLYWETDTTALFRSTGSIWEQVAMAVSASPGGSPTGAAGGDLGLTFPNPDVLGLQQDALPSKLANGFLKRDSGNTAWEEVAYGAVANTVTQGNDTRLSNARTPTTHHVTHQPGGTDQIVWSTVIMEGLDSAKPAAASSNDGTLYFSTDIQTLWRSNAVTWEQVAQAVGGSGPPSGAAGGDLAISYPNPEVIGLQGDALASTAANGFIKRNTANTAWEEVAYGSASNTVTQGNDTRLTNARTPTAHASTHLPAQTDPIDWVGTIHAAGTHAARPSAVAGNAGCLYFETDTTSLFRSTGSAWVQIAAGTGVGGSVTSVDMTVPADQTVTGGAITTSGTFAVTDNTQSANTVKAGPASGGVSVPAYRALVPLDLPVFVASGASHAAGAVPDPGASAGSTKFLREDATFAVPPGTGLTAAYTTVQDEGSALTQRSTLNVVGRGIVADDSGGVTRLRVRDPATMTYIEDEFFGGTVASGSIGALGWAFSFGTAANQAGEANHPGILRRTNTTGQNGTTSLINTFLPAETFDCLWVFRPVDMAADTTIKIGLMSGQGTPTVTDGIYLEGLSTDFSGGVMTWFLVTRASSSQNRLTSGVTTAANAWVKVRLRRIDASTVGCTVNAGTEVTQTLTIPTAALGPAALLSPTATRSIDYDAFDLLIMGMTR